MGGHLEVWHVIFEISGYYNSPILAFSGGNEQDDGLQDQTKASTLYLSHSKWLFVIAL